MLTYYSQNMNLLFTKYKNIIHKVLTYCSQNINVLFTKYEPIVYKI